MPNNLRGAVLSRYPSITAFAKAMKWDRKKASRIINNIQQPSVKDIEDIAALLDIVDDHAFVSIFFDGLSTARTINPLDYYRT